MNTDINSCCNPFPIYYPTVTMPSSTIQYASTIEQSWPIQIKKVENGFVLKVNLKEYVFLTLEGMRDFLEKEKL
jgi:hypothetical protein